MKKGMNALETIFMLFILIIVVVVVVQMFTKFTSAGQAKLGASLKEVEKVSGYKTAIQTCENACSDYRATGSEIDLINFCTRAVEMDIDFSGKADEGEPTTEDLESGKPVMLAPIGYVVCEKNIYCPQLTKCNNRYDLDECLTKLCRYYYNKYRKIDKDNALTRAQNIIKGLYRKGECNIDDIVDSGSRYGIPDINWYTEFIESLDCGTRLGMKSSGGGSGGGGLVINLKDSACTGSNLPCFLSVPPAACVGGTCDSNGKNCADYTVGSTTYTNGYFYDGHSDYVTIDGNNYVVDLDVGGKIAACIYTKTK